LRTQFLDQPFNIQNYETTNLTGSIEFEPTDNLTFYFDATLNDQQRIGKSTRAFFSGTGANPAIDATISMANPDGSVGGDFETIDLGSIDGEFGTLDLGPVNVVTDGITQPDNQCRQWHTGDL